MTIMVVLDYTGDSGDHSDDNDDDDDDGVLGGRYGEEDE